jgi:hypothetical protein
MEYNNNSNIFLNEGLEYKDLEGMMKPEIHVDEFDSKMGDNADIIVISFFVRNQEAAIDLMNWFEKGYDFVLDADRSPGEIKPNRYLVYVEIRRRSTAGIHVRQLLEDINTLTEYEPSDWIIDYKNQRVPFTLESFEQLIPLSPKEYRRQNDEDLNEMRVAAGLPYKAVYESNDADIRAIKIAAGIKL